MLWICLKITKKTMAAGVELQPPLGNFRPPDPRMCPLLQNPKTPLFWWLVAAILNLSTPGLITQYSHKFHYWIDGPLKHRYNRWHFVDILSGRRDTTAVTMILWIILQFPVLRPPYWNTGWWHAQIVPFHSPEIFRKIHLGISVYSMWFRNGSEMIGLGTFLRPPPVPVKLWGLIRLVISKCKYYIKHMQP